MKKILKLIITFITILIMIVSLFINISTEAWMILSAIALPCIFIMGAFGFYYLKKHPNEGKDENLICGAAIIAIWYLIISAISYFNIIENTIADGPACVVISIFAIIVFYHIIFGNKLSIYKK
ncbi:MAG: hypothetical protein HFJ17_00100 [Clostridia bacterium]|nr:hypothetical protein [Clostridia bacterium]